MTMSPQLGRRDRRTLVIGVATVSALIGLSRGLPALRAWMRDRAAQARAAAEQLAAVESGIRRLPALRESLLVRRARLAALDSVIQPCRGFQALFGANKESCVNGHYVGPHGVIR